ncbi:MAG: hypothetical protein K0S36_1086 [Nitrosospira multiformis]|nr:hypothetical protein [Nitrosospira multiformis]
MRFLKWIIAFVLLFTLFAAGTYLVKEGESEGRLPLTHTDFEPLLNAIHTTWTKIPANRGITPEIKAFDQARLALEENLLAIDWSKGFKKKDSDKLKAVAESVHEASAKLAIQLSTQDLDLYNAMASVQAEARQLTNRVEPSPRQQLSRDVVVAYSEAMKAFAKMVTDWPFVTIVGIVLLLIYADRKGGVTNLFGGVQSIKVAGGNEIIFSAVQADERSKTANEVFMSYRKKATEEFGAMAKAENLSGRLKNVCENRIKAYLSQRVTDYLTSKGEIKDSTKLTSDDTEKINMEFTKRWQSLRFTIFVEDLLFTSTLCQLIDYYPNSGRSTAGRAWSLRYGMIGHVWRLQRSHSETCVTTDEEQLVKEWGMTRDEVRNFVSKKKTFTTVVLTDEKKDNTPLKKEDNSTPIGLFYVDSELEDAFALALVDKSCAELHCLIENACVEFGLTQALKKVVRRIESRKLDIRIFYN